MTRNCNRCGETTPRGCEDWDCHLGWTREPAPEPTREQQAVIERFAIFEPEQRMERVAKAINIAVHHAIARDWRNDQP